MSIEIVVPQVGEAISAARLTQWYKKEGDFVRKGEPLFAVDTDKAILDVEAFSDGILEKILVGQDSDVQPEMVVGLLRGVGEERTDAKASVAPAAIEAPAGRAGQSESAEKIRAASAKNPPLAISPKARRLARELGVDLTALAERKAGEMITEVDIRALAAGGGQGSEELTMPLTKMRETIAMRTQRSKQQVPHFYLMAQVDMRAAIRARETITPRPSFTVLVARACACALQEMPEANAYYTEQGLRRRRTIDIGIAASVDGGLLVPVLRQVDTLSVQAMDTQLKEMRERLDRGKYRQNDFGERSLTLSNLGMHAVDAFVAIIDTPDPVILAMGSIQERVVVEKGAPVVRPMCTLTLSVDHRAMDGVAGARLLNVIRKHLEEPSPQP